MEKNIDKKNLGVKFKVDIERKQIILYFKNGEMRTYVEKLIEKFPNLSNEELGKEGSKRIAVVLSKVIEHIGEQTNLDLLNFTPKFVNYNSKRELPRQLQVA